MRLIDADELETDMLYTMCGTGYQHLAMSTIRSARTIDAEPIRHGHWIYHDDVPFSWTECSECHTRGNLYEKYCSECGAKMDEVRE